MRSFSMADSMKWVSFRPTEDTLKASREKACFPTRNVYLKEKKIENSAVSGSSPCPTFGQGVKGQGSRVEGNMSRLEQLSVLPTLYSTT